ncbi:hypothetical protein C1889_00325 [Pseudomonas sp. FW507-12TSA]|nr:hypothetical protein C1889_00325 [Pseudomonas sp. FW507-12TSA]
MAWGGVPPAQCRSEGTPSLGEAPDAGAESLWLLWVGRHSGPSKVTRCKSGTLSGHTRSNGYVPHQNQPPDSRHNHSNITFNTRLHCSSTLPIVRPSQPDPRATLAGRI